MLVNKHKNRLFAFLSIVCLQAGPPGQTLRALPYFVPECVVKV